MERIDNIEYYSKTTNAYDSGDPSPEYESPVSLEVGDKDYSFKIHVLDSSYSEVTSTYLFSQNESNDPDVVSTGISLYPDDTIQSIKMNISKVIEKAHGQLVPIESMYLFCRHYVSAAQLDVEKMYQDITRHNSYELTPTRMQTFLNNFSMPYTVTPETDLSAFLEIVQREVTSRANLIQGVLKYVPIGFQYIQGGSSSSTVDYSFPVNPFQCTPEVLKEMQENNVNHVLIPYDHHLLLRYMPMFQNELYVCFSSSFAPDVTKYYFPLYTSLTTPQMNLLSYKNNVKHDTSDFLFNVTKNYPLEIPRMERFIQEFEIIMLNDTRIPLDILFKNIATNASFPGIVYNPGKNKENILRLYTTRVSKNGRRIPYLSKKQITQFCKFSKKNTLVFYIPKKTRGEGFVLETDANLSGDIDVYVKLDMMGNLTIHCDEPILEKVTLDMQSIFANRYENLDRLIRYHVNPLIQHLNAFLQKSGYALPAFESMTSPTVGIKHLHIRWKIPQYIVRPFSILEELPCLRNLFDIYEGADVLDEDHNLVLRYKRVYNDNEAQGLLIREFKRKSKSAQSIVESLMLNYNLSSGQAMKRLEKYENDHEERILIKSANKEYSFPIEIHYEDQELLVDIYKYCRDCGAQKFSDDIVEYVAGPKGRIHRKRRKPSSGMSKIDLPHISYMNMIEIYMNSFLEIVLYRDQIPIPAMCEKIVFEAEAAGTEAVVLVEEIPVEQDQEEEILEPVEGEEEEEEEEGEVDHEEEEEEEGEVDQEEEDEEEGFLFGGDKKKRVKSKLNRLQEKDPQLFFTSTKETGNDSYGRICQRNKQPIIMNEEEHVQQSRIHPELKTISYATSPNKQYWYACPKYWCAATNQILTQEQVDNGECKGNVEISQYNTPSFEDPKKHPDGFCMPCCFKAKEDKPLHLERVKKCLKQTSGDELPMDDAENIQASLMGSISMRPTKDDRNILKYSSKPPVTMYRWSLLPKTVQYFLNMDYSKMVVINPLSTKILPNQLCYLLYGIEQPKQQSFLGLFAEIYSYKHKIDPPISANELRNILIDALNLDLFVTYQNGAWGSVFGNIRDDTKPDVSKYASTLFYKSMDWNHPSQVQYFEKMVKAYENFLSYLKDTQAVIDHTYLWEIMAGDHAKILPGGCNLVILELNDNEKLIDIVCLYGTTTMFDPKKETFFILKRDAFYEPIYQYYDRDVREGKTIEVKKGFVLDSFPPHASMRRIMEMVESTVLSHCMPKPLDISNPTSKNLDAQSMVQVLISHDYIIHTQLWNYSNKIVGFYVTKKGANIKNGVVVPCFPSAVLIGTPYPVTYISDTVLVPSTRLSYTNDKNANDKNIKKMGALNAVKRRFIISGGKVDDDRRDDDSHDRVDDDVDDDDPYNTALSGENNYKTVGGATDSGRLWKTYTETLIRLTDIVHDTEHQIMCEPLYKIVDPISKKVTAIMTESMQYVPVYPHEAPIEDGLAILERSNDVFADQTLALEQRGQEQREERIMRIVMETQFYQVFRALVRQQLNVYEHQYTKRSILEKIKQYSKNNFEDYARYLTEIATLLEEISKDMVGWLDYSGKDLLSISRSTIRPCLDAVNEPGEPLYCRGKRIIFPKYHLLCESMNRIGDCNNRNIYYMRLADELLRYTRIQWFMFQPRTFLNISSGMTDYTLTPQEILVLESFLNNDDYFRDLIPFNVTGYIHQTNYDTAEPYAQDNNQVYPLVTIEQQKEMIRHVPEEIQNDFSLVPCILKKDTKNQLVEGNNRSIWKRSFPSDTREFTFKSEPITCSYAMVMNIRRLFKLPPMSILHIKQDIWHAYEPYMDEHGAKILRILKDQYKKSLLESTGDDLQTAIMTEDYFITDMDLWALTTYWKLPVMLFSIGKIKMTQVDQWMYLNSQYFETQDDATTIFQPIAFVRTPLTVEKGVAPKYSIIEQLFTLSQLGDMGLIIQKGVQQLSPNITSLERFLQQRKIIRRGRRAKNDQEEI